MSLLVTVIIVLVLLNLMGGAALPTWRSGQFYYPSYGAILLVILILYLLGYR